MAWVGAAIRSKTDPKVAETVAGGAGTTGSIKDLKLRFESGCRLFSDKGFRECHRR